MAIPIATSLARTIRPGLLAFVISLYLQSTLGYGIVFPRSTDVLVLGRTYKLTWSSADDVVSIWLRGYTIGSVYTIATNISNAGWYEWNIPSDLPGEFHGSRSWITIKNGNTNVTTFLSDELNIVGKDEQLSSSSTPTPTWGRFTSPTGAPYESLPDRTSLNVTWEADVPYIRLGYKYDYSNTTYNITALIPNRQYHVFYYNLGIPVRLNSHCFLLGTNDSVGSAGVIKSESFYAEPQGYPNTSFNSLSQQRAQILFPTGQDTETLNVNDTVVFLWDPPLTDIRYLKLVMNHEAYAQTYLLSGTTWNSTSLTYRLAQGRGPTSSTYYGLQFRFGLLSMEKSLDYHGDGFSGYRMIAQSDPFRLWGPSGAETTWVAPATRTASSTETTVPPTPNGTANSDSDEQKSPGGLSKASKIGIGLGVALGCCMILIAIGVWVFLRRKKMANNRDSTSNRYSTSNRDSTSVVGEQVRTKREEGTPTIRYELPPY